MNYKIQVFESDVREELFEFMLFIEEFYQYVYDDPNRKLPNLEAGTKKLKEVISDKKSRIFVARNNEGKIIGTMQVNWIARIGHGDYKAELENVFVSVEAQGSGVAEEMFNYVRKYCVENGVNTLKLTSGNDLLRAHKFYTKMGGVETEKMFRFDFS